MPEIRPRHLLVALAAAAILFVTLVALLLRVEAYLSIPLDMIMVVIGVGLGWAGLGGSYLALGRQHLAIRLAISTASALAAGEICSRADGEDARLWCGAMLFAVCIIAVPLVYLWARGLRLTHPEHPTIEFWKQRRQFSLWGLLTAITCVSILLAIAIRLQFPIDKLYNVMVICGSAGGITYAAGGFLLSRIRPVWSFFAIPAAATAATAALSTIEAPMTLLDGVAAVLGITLVVTIWMLILRLAGYYLRWPDYSALETVGPSKRLVDEQGRPIEATLPLPASTRSSTAIEDRQS